MTESAEHFNIYASEEEAKAESKDVKTPVKSDPEVNLMEKRVGVVSVLIVKRESVPEVNQILSIHHDIILGRQGLPLKDKGIHVISLIVEGTTDQIGSLTGKLGRLEGVQVKSMLTRHREDDHALDDPENGHIH